MTVSRYRLTAWGKLGAILFVAPTPVAAYFAIPPKVTDAQLAYKQALQDVTGRVEIFTPSPTLLIALATASLIGLVLLFIGREIITTEA
ncbi:hypothetical protein RMS29_028310 (plasmid) [Agrobacterium rosae]|uniref:Uncharacterized protein n=1 Tax=Agrobacterium rosae TaxID=1972867 RepID=A0ABU4W5Z4_9HYPH|nr:hypothetical protein [Agrobacterium rosae]MDX8332891.1 hypothetical protein [Agrobacterium rosae]